MDTLRIYFDTNLVQYASYMLKDEAFGDILVTGNSKSFFEKFIRHGPRWVDDIKALRFILDTDDQLSLIFVTTKLTLEETLRAPPNRRDEMMRVYRSLSRYGNPVRWPKPTVLPERPKIGTMQALRRILPDPTDARHVYYSLVMRCNVFLTGDYKSILEHVRELKTLGVNGKSPHQLLESIYGEDLWRKGAGLALVTRTGA